MVWNSSKVLYCLFCLLFLCRTHPAVTWEPLGSSLYATQGVCTQDWTSSTCKLCALSIELYPRALDCSVLTDDRVWGSPSSDYGHFWHCCGPDTAVHEEETRRCSCLSYWGHQDHTHWGWGICMHCMFSFNSRRNYPSLCSILGDCSKQCTGGQGVSLETLSQSSLFRTRDLGCHYLGPVEFGVLGSPSSAAGL